MKGCETVGERVEDGVACMAAAAELVACVRDEPAAGGAEGAALLGGDDMVFVVFADCALARWRRPHTLEPQDSRLSSGS